MCPSPPVTGLALILAMIAALLLIPLVGCVTRSPTTAEIEHIFPEDGPPENASASAGLDIYVDGSGSMRGFLATNDSIFRKTVGDLLLSATQNRFDLRVYKFSSKIEPVTGAAITAVQNPSFYNGADTPLASLLTQISAHPERTAIVLSDLVLSSQSEDSQKLVQVLASLARQRPQIKLLGYRSDFKGSYQSERSKKTYALSLTQSVPSGGRPFYMLIVAPNPASMEKAQGDLLDHLQAQPKIFDATSQAFAVQGATLTTGATAKKQWLVVSKYIVRNKRSNRFETAFRLARSPAEETVDLPVTLTYASGVPPNRADEVSPLTRADKVSLKSQVTSFSRNFSGHSTSSEVKQAKSNEWLFSPVNDVTIPLTGQLQHDGDKSEMRLLLNLHPPRHNEWSVYRISLRPGESNLDLPGWTKEWSTDDDSSAASGNKTYLLRLLVGTMESAITQERVCGDWILRVGGEG